MTTPKKKTTWVMTFFPGGARPLLPKVRFQHVQHPERYTACRRVTVQMEPVEAHMELKWSPIEFIWLASGRFQEKTEGNDRKNNRNDWETNRKHKENNRKHKEHH